jgi:hypothetical protein
MGERIREEGENVRNGCKEVYMLCHCCVPMYIVKILRHKRVKKIQHRHRLKKIVVTMGYYGPSVDTLYPIRYVLCTISLHIAYGISCVK